MRLLKDRFSKVSARLAPENQELPDMPVYISSVPTFHVTWVCLEQQTKYLFVLCVIQKLLYLLTTTLEKHPNAVLQIGMDTDDRIDYFYCQTSAMKTTLELYRYPEVLFVDSTYRFVVICPIAIP